jgi:dihydroorotase/N-acyl-D-amino-acid deacylase
MIALTNGLVFDGTGAPPVPAGVLIDGERIAAIGSLPPGIPCIDCSGLAVAPGFVDLHSHSDLQVLEGRLEKVKQGVTTEVVGNCGFSPFPHSGDPAPLREFGAGILGRSDGWGWTRASEYLACLASSGGPVGAVPLAGHGSLRIAVAGPRQGPLTPAELDRMEGLLEDALDGGCAGFSTGLMYAPGSSAPAAELERMCGVVARKTKLYATHMRSYAAGLVDAVREQLDLARRAGCRLQISHLQAAGRGNWALQRRALDEIEAARSEGIDVEFDIYPYQCGSTVLTQWLPQWALDGGRAAMLARLNDPGQRARIAREMEEDRAQEWSDITISSVATAANAGLVGKTLPDAAAALDLLIEEGGAVNVISFNQSESNLRELLTHPLCSVISDGFYVQGKAHPRLYGTFPELLGSVVRRRQWMSLPEAVHRITGKPAARLRWADRGLLRPGYRADVTVFDPARVGTRSTYDEPAVDPDGIVTVMRNGKVVFGRGVS